MSVRVLVAGGAGFIGSHLVDRLLKRVEIQELVIVDNLWTGVSSNVSRVQDRRLRFVKADVETVEVEGYFDEIYNLASPASPPRFMSEPIRTISANVVGTLRLLKLLKPHGVIGFTSTSEVYGDPSVSPQPESYRGSVDCTGPRSSYDESKRCVEALLFEARRVHGTKIKVARLFNVFGPRTRPDDGRAISNFITQGLRGQPLTIYGDGRQSRSWGYVDDVVDALERFFWLDGSEFPGPINIGNDREVSVLTLAQHMIATHFPRLKIVFAPPVPQDPASRRPDLDSGTSDLAGLDLSGVIRRRNHPYD